MKLTLTLGLLAGMLAIAGEQGKPKGDMHEIGCAAYKDCEHGFGHDKGGTPNPTPEPGTFVMGLAAVAGVGFAAWRRKR